MTISVKDAAIVVTSTTTPATRCSLLLTSPLMRETTEVTPDSNSKPDGESNAAAGKQPLQTSVWLDINAYITLELVNNTQLKC